MAVTELDTSNFDQFVLQAEKPVLVDFWAVWCGPCRTMGPIIEDIAAERDDFAVCKCNVDIAGPIAQRYGIASIPTLMLFKGGKPVHSIIGAQPKANILAELAPHLA
jgi:thioredoxin 1